MRDASSFVMRPLPSPLLPEAEEFCWPDMVAESGCLFVLEGWKVGKWVCCWWVECECVNVK
jgi:hypothetical protein